MRSQMVYSLFRQITLKAAANAVSLILVLGAASISSAQTGTSGSKEVTVTVKGESWDADSRGFAYFLGMSETEGEKKAARRGSRISVDGQPDKYTFANPGPGFELTFITKEPSFRLVVEGDRFPRVLTQPYKVPEGGGVVEIGRIDALRAEGPEHSWPLVMAANALGYETAWEMLADNKAAIRLLLLGSGEEGAPEWTENATISVTTGNSTQDGSATTVTSSPFLKRIVQSSYVFPFDMNKKDTFFLFDVPSVGAFLMIVSFSEGEKSDKDVTIKITDHVTDELLDPPRPWIFEPLIVSVRNGFTTPSIRVQPKNE